MKRDRQNETSIISIEKHSQNYSLVDNAGIRDANLSYKATGLWTFLISHPPDWRVNLNHLINSKTDGRDSVMSGLWELSEAGYLLYLRWRSDDGLFSSRYIVFETPQLKEKYLDRMSDEDKAKITTPSNPSKARSQKRQSEATSENPQWSQNEKTITDNPERIIRLGLSEQTNNIYTNDLKPNTEQETRKEDPPTPQRGMDISQNVGEVAEVLKPEPEQPPSQPEDQQPKTDSLTTPKISPKDRSSASALFFRLTTEQYDRIKDTYNQHKPKAWQSLNSVYKALKDELRGIVGGDDFRGDLEAFLQRLENALTELNHPASSFSWWSRQTDKGLITLIRDGRLFQFSDAWTAREQQAANSSDSDEEIPQWLQEAYAEFQAKKAG